MEIMWFKGVCRISGSVGGRSRFGGVGGVEGIVDNTCDNVSSNKNFKQIKFMNAYSGGWIMK